MQVYDYARPLNADEICVHLWNGGGRADFAQIRSGIEAAAARYRFTLRIVDWDEVEAFQPFGYVHRLLLVPCAGPFDAELVETLIGKALTRYSVISVAFSYRSEAEMLSHAPAIEHYKRQSGDCINFLRPLPVESGACEVLADKIIDNAICDGVRIKYDAVQISSQIPDLPGNVREFFQASSWLFERYELYHRSASDGYFACRQPGEKGFYITATKTYKFPLDFDRISYVESYDRAENRLRYRGRFLPSSDAVEAAVLLALQPSLCSLVHTHASHLFTRNPAYAHKILVGRASYGEPALGDLLAKALGSVNDGFVIMDDHGEVFASELPSVSPVLLSELALTGSRGAVG